MKLWKKSPDHGKMHIWTRGHGVVDHALPVSSDGSLPAVIAAAATPLFWFRLFFRLSYSSLPKSNSFMLHKLDLQTNFLHISFYFSFALSRIFYCVAQIEEMHIRRTCHWFYELWETFATFLTREEIELERSSSF